MGYIWGATAAGVFMASYYFAAARRRGDGGEGKNEYRVYIFDLTWMRRCWGRFYAKLANIYAQ